VALRADYRLTGQSVIDATNQIALERGLPHARTVDHGTEFTFKALDDWCGLRGAGSTSFDPVSRDCIYRIVQRTTARRMSERE
jgi:hypothetical protein